MARLPGARADFVLGTKASPEFYRFLATIDAGAGASAGAVSELQSDVKVISEKLGSPSGDPNQIPPVASFKPTLRVDAPLTFTGWLPNGLMEIGWGGTTDDVPEGGTNHYYNITRAWFFG